MERIDRVNEQFKREIGQIVQKDLADPRLKFVTITAAEVSRDLQRAKVYFSVLGGAQAAEAAHRGLEKASGMIRRLVGQRITMRYTPEIFFAHDKSIEMGARIEKTLKEIHDASSKDSSDNPTP